MIEIYGSGYLGGEILKYLSEKGQEVRALERFEKPSKSATLVIDASFPRDYLSKKTMKSYFEIVTQRCQMSSSQGTDYLYLGSFSAADKPRSKYGKYKLKAETLVKKSQGYVLRVGLVFDERQPGGRCAEYEEILRSLPVIPIVPEDWCRIKITHIRDLLEKIESFANLKSKLRNRVEEVPGTTDESINILSLRYGLGKKKLEIPELLMWSAKILITALPIPLFDNLKSIFYKSNLL